MKKLRFFELRSKVYKGFLVSTFGLVFLALNLILVMTYRHISENMREEEIRVLRNKLYTVAEDMDNQMNSMTNIVMRIVSWNIFRLDYIQDGKYHAVEALKQLKGYSDFSDVSRNYFIKYADYDQLFTSAGTTISPEYYFEQKQGMKDSDAVLELLDTLCNESRRGMILYKEGDRTLFLYPLQAYIASGSNTQGVVGFFVTPADIYARVEKIAGNIQGEMSLFYDDFCILGNVAAQDAGSGLVSAKLNNFQVYVEIDKDEYFSWKNVFSAKEMITLAGVVALLLALTCIAAWWNYLPFRKVVRKYGAMLDDGPLLDWGDIDDLIASLLHEKKANGQLVDEQYRILREQAIHLIVSGGYSEQLQKRLTFLNIDLNYSVFGIIRTNFQKEQLTEDCREDLYRNVGELSEKGYCLYSYWDSDNALQILAAAEEEYELTEAVELLQSLFETMGLEAEVELCSICHELKKLHLLGKETDKGLEADKGQNAPSRRGEALKRKTGWTADELEQTNRKEGLTDEIPERHGREQEVPADGQGLSAEKQIEAADAEQRGDARRDAAKPKSTIREAVEYIESHCTDYNLSLDMIAQQAQITPQYLCVKLKQEIGMSYKEYLTKLRIDVAKKLLAEEDISVGDVCQKVGYINVSYFIKIFQKYTGVTPTRYRAERQGQENR